MSVYALTIVGAVGRTAELRTIKEALKVYIDDGQNPLTPEAYGANYFAAMKKVWDTFNSGFAAGDWNFKPLFFKGIGYFRSAAPGVQDFESTPANTDNVLEYIGVGNRATDINKYVTICTESNSRTRIRVIAEDLAATLQTGFANSVIKVPHKSAGSSATSFYAVEYVVVNGVASDAPTGE